MFGLSQGGDNNHKFRTVLPFSKLFFTLSFDKKIHMEVISSRGFSGFFRGGPFFAEKIEFR